MMAASAPSGALLLAVALVAASCGSSSGGGGGSVSTPPSGTTTPPPTVIGEAPEEVVHEVRIARHATALLDEASADAILSDASLVLQAEDSPDDVACAVTFVRQGQVEVFEVGDGAVDTGLALATVFGIEADVKAVRDLNFCQGTFNTSYRGCGILNQDNLIVERYLPEIEGILWAHEFGHNKGRPHRDTSNRNLMFWALGTNRREVNRNECDAFSGAGIAVADTGTSLPLQLAERSRQLPPVREFVTQIYFHGLPLDQAARYGDEQVDLLVAMLNDPDQVLYHENIALTLGMIGSARAADALISYIGSPPPPTEDPLIARQAHKGKVGAVVALGYLVNLSESERALAFLTGFTSPAVLAESVSRRSAIDNAAGAELRKYALIGLGLSGNERAAEHLEMLSRMSSTIVPQGTTPAFDFTGILDQSMRFNEEVSEEGIVEYYTPGQ